jgi:flagellar protein FlaJ
VVKVPRIAKHEKKNAWVISGILGAAIFLTAFVPLWENPAFDEHILLAVVVTIFPPAVLDYVDYRWKRSIDEHLPSLFRGVVQAQQTGMTLPQAVEEASKRSYGPLSKELKRMVVQMSWGLSFEKTLRSLGKQVNTTLVRRSVPLITEASRAGGQIEKVFDPMGKFMETTMMLDKERQTQTRPYVAIVYVAFFVFLFTVVLLLRTFFTQTVDFRLMGFAISTPEEIRRILFHMSAIQAFFGGLVAGKMGEGTLSAGLKHCVILLTCGYLIFKFLA